MIMPFDARRYYYYYDLGTRTRIRTELDASALAVINAFTTPPTAERRALIGSTVSALKSAGVWDLLDVLYMFAAADSQAALINWKNPGTFNATAVNSPTFTADRGFTGDGATSNISSYNPSTAGGNYSLNSAHISIRLRTEVDPGGGVAGQLSGTPRVSLRPRRAADNSMRGLINDATEGVYAVGSVTTSIGQSLINRSASNARQAYRNGASIGSDSQASTAVANASMSILRDSATFTAGEAASYSAGGSLDSTKVAALFAAELAYMQGVGAV